MADPVRRRLFLVWIALIWLAWLVAGELPDALRAVPALAWKLAFPPWPAAREAAKTAIFAGLGAALVAAACLGAGAAVLRILGRNPETSCMLALGAGIPAMAAQAQAAGLLGLAYPWVLAFCLTPAVFAAPLLLREGGARNCIGNISGILRWIALGAALAVGLAAMAPAAAWDEIVYHARVPSVYLFMHKVVPIPEIFPSFFPFSGEMLFMLAGNLGGDQAARLLHAFFWLFTGLTAAQLARAMWGDEAGGFALGLFLTLPIGQIIAARAYVEFIMALPLFGAILVVFERTNRKSRGKMLLAGWLAGSALGVKYLGGAYAIPLGIAIFFLRPGGVRPFLVFSFSALAVCWHWLVRNVLWTGNPVYPLIWGGPHWTSLDMAGWQADARAFEFDLPALLAMPWRLLMDRSGDGGIHPLLPIGLVLSLLIRNRRGGAIWALSGGMLAVWWISAPLPRYLVPALILFCILASGSLAGKGLGPQAAKWTRSMTLTGMVAALLCGIASIEAKTRPYGVTLGKTSVQEYLEDYFHPAGYMEVLGMLEETVPAQERVYFLGHLHSFPLARRTWFEFLYTRPALYWWLGGAESAERIRIRARQAALTHIVYQPLGAAAILASHPERMDWTKRSLEAYGDFWRRHAREQARIKSWLIYRLERSPGQTGEFDFIPGTEGAP